MRISSTVQSFSLPSPLSLPYPMCRKRLSSCVYALKRDHHAYGKDGKLVDENMIVLRMRIQEMKKVEKKEDSEPPLNWMDWEKKYYPSYDYDIYRAIGFLQSLLVETRPSIVLGGILLLAFSFSTSLILVLHLLMVVVEGSC